MCVCAGNGLCDIIILYCASELECKISSVLFTVMLTVLLRKIAQIVALFALLGNKLHGIH